MDLHLVHLELEASLCGYCHKGVATNVAANHVEELVKNPDFAELCQCEGEIGFAVLKSYLSPTLQALVKKCESCQQYYGKKSLHQPYYTCSSYGYTYY